MTQEEKELLLKDLCVRLPHRVMIKPVGENKIIGLWDLKDVDNLPLPYLRPMSSMTEEERKQIAYQCGISAVRFVSMDFSAMTVIEDMLLKNHFDYRGLIPMGLALEAPEGMYK